MTPDTNLNSAPRRISAGVIVGALAFFGNSSFLIFLLSHLTSDLFAEDSDDQRSFAIWFLAAACGASVISLFIAIFVGHFVAFHDFNPPPNDE